MRYIVDTHVFLWALLDPDKISSKAQKIISSQENSIFISVLTFWEISLKYALGKLELKGVKPQELPDLASQINFEILPLNSKDAAAFYQLPRSHHKDPFDRMIIWQAVRNDLILISNDKYFDEYQQFGLRIV